MTPDDIFRMAREVGFELDCCSLEWHSRIRRFAELVEASVRSQYKLIGEVAGGAGPRTFMHPCVNYLLPTHLALYARIGEPTATEHYTTEDGT